jgi:hypothetical protein
MPLTRSLFTCALVAVMVLAIACASFAVDNLPRADIIPVVSEEQSTAAPALVLC